MHVIQIRNFPDATYRRLRELAKEERRSLQQEASWLLEKALEIFGRSSLKNWDQVAKTQKEMKLRYGALPDSTPLIRQMRQER